MLRYAITDRTWLGDDEASRRAGLLACVARWANQHVDYIQLREKDLPEAELLALTRAVSDLLGDQPSPPKLLLNAPLELALVAAPFLDGLHLPASSGLSLAQARQRLVEAFRQPPLLSISCHTLAEVEAAAAPAGSPDLILFGPVFGKSIPVSGSPGHPDRSYRTVTPAVGLDSLRAACLLAGKIPVLALGGVTRENLADCQRAGAAGIAGIRLFQEASGV